MSADSQNTASSWMPRAGVDCMSRWRLSDRHADSPSWSHTSGFGSIRNFVSGSGLLGFTFWNQRADSKNREPNWIASWLIAALHLTSRFFHFRVIFCKASSLSGLRNRIHGRMRRQIRRGLAAFGGA
jgi:hypothetical protein